MNMKDALEQALLATKAYIDDNHYNQTEIDTLLDGKSDEGHTHNYLPLSGGTIESAEFAPLKIKSAGGSAGSRLVLDITNEDLNKIGGFWSELSYVPDLKLNTEYTLVIGDNSYTSTCQLGQDLQSREILFFNQNIYIRINWDGNASAYKEGVTFVRHYDTTEFKLYEAGAGEIASAIAFENNDGVLGHIGMVNDSGSELLRLTPDGQASYRIVDEGNFTDIITYSNIGAAPAYHGEHFSLGEGSNNAYYGDKGKIAYDHSQSAHAPSNAQKNSDITKAEIEAKLTGNITSHTHSYAGSSSAGGAATSANKVNSNLVIKINGGTTEGTNMFTFDGSAAKTINLTAANLGAPASHNHDGRYYTETEINTKFTDLNTEINNAFTGVNNGIAAEEERALAAESALQTAIDLEASRAATAEAKALTDAKSYTDTKVAAVLDSAPETLNTLNELAAALGDDPNFATTIANQIGGKAPTSHASSATTYGVSSASNYGHAKASGTTPKANGTAAVGSETSSFARGDHVHPLQTSVSGNAGSANKVNNALKVQLNSGTTEGTNQFTFDGSGAKTINITPANIGAAAAEHGTHLTLGTGSSNAFRGDYGNTAYQHSQAAHAPADAQKNQNAFSNFTVGSTTIAADSTTDTLTIVAGSNVTITPDATNDKITIAATDTKYTHPSYTAKSSGFYKVTVDASGHVSATTAVTKSDITGLGIPGQDTVYTHPTHTAYSSGLYKVTVNNLGHVTAATAVAKSDITALGIPGSDTNTWRGIQDNLTSTATDQSLTANQGRILKGLVDNKADMIEDTDLTTMLTTIFGTAAASLDE